MPSARTHQVRRHLSYANVMSTLAVCLVLVAGGTAVAATAAKNTVTSASVKDGSLKSKDLKDGKAVASSDVVDGSLTGADVADNSLTGADVNESTLTLPAPGANTVGSGAVIDGSLTGADVSDGSLTKADLGTASVTSSELGPLVKVEKQGAVGFGAFGTVIADCPAGSVAISGGARSNDVNTFLLASSKENVAESWVVQAKNTNASGSVNVSAFVYCLAG